mmetsp:Transcript_17525/g.52720  ORF Transcript_17525/g.52720 Transcript_17525/m.52720 type:complete len:247 (+) Transcript_17525:1262-2002(+)
MRLMRALYCSSFMRPRLTCPCQRAAIFCMPASSHSCLASLRTMGIPFCAKHMAMPPPIRPAPRMPTFLMGSGLRFTPGTFEHSRSAKKRWRRAADCTPKTSFVNSSASTFRPSAQGFMHAALRHLQIAAGATMRGIVLKAISSPCSSMPPMAKNLFAWGTGRFEMGAGGLESANAAASSTTLPFATRSTMPFLAASFAFRDLPWRIICMAVMRGAILGRRCVPWPPGRRPRFTSGRPTDVPSTATR